MSFIGERETLNTYKIYQGTSWLWSNWISIHRRQILQNKDLLTPLQR